MVAPPDLERGVAPLSPPAPHSSCSLDVGLLPAAALGQGRVVALLGRSPDLRHGSSSRPPLLGCRSLTPSVAPPTLGEGLLSISGML